MNSLPSEQGRGAVRTFQAKEESEQRPGRTTHSGMTGDSQSEVRTLNQVVVGDQAER